MGAQTRIALLALVGVLLAAGIGIAAYVVSRDSVGLPVTKLEPRPRELSPGVARRPGPAARTQSTTTTASASTTTGEAEHHRRGRGGRSSGHGGGGDD
jgi:hypothetical protein